MSNNTSRETEAVALLLYDVYCEAVGGLAYDGKPLPSWAEFSMDPQKAKQANAWRAVADAMIAVLRADMNSAEEDAPQVPTRSRKVSYMLPPATTPKMLAPSRKNRADGRNDTGYDVKAYTIEYSERTHHGVWDKVLKVLTFGLYKPIPCYITVNTGVRLQADDPTIGFEGRMNSRASKRPFVLGNCDGTIDPGYTGEILFIFNTFAWATWKDINDYFQVGNVVGQIIPERQEPIELQHALLLVETDREDKGFGSTAKS